MKKKKEGTLRAGFSQSCRIDEISEKEEGFKLAPAVDLGAVCRL